MKIFPQLGTEKREWGREYLPKRKRGDGVKLTPIPVLIPAQELISIPIPIPIGCGDFPPMRGGPLIGVENPRPVAIPI